jgi:16S rRNA (adenine1518-N6/adenine1519-N6)-dimethyltransferase
MKIPQLIHLLKTYDITPDKSKGQHFLIDETVVGDMLEVAGVGETDTVLEIGPGVGVLTAGLVQKAGQVYAYELDDQLADLITSQNESNLTVIRGDVLQSPLPPAGFTPNGSTRLSHEVGRELAQIPVRKACKKVKVIRHQHE